MADQYCIADGYTPRLEPDYFDDTTDPELVWQPDVYAEAARVAAAVGATVVIDVGAGNGDKLAEVDVPTRIALDFGGNLERGPERHPDLEWRRYDAEGDAGLPVTPAELDGAVVICSDVIEHLPHPERMVGHVRSALDAGAVACVISTPDRVRLGGADDTGPPRNRHHVREWTCEELVAFLRREGVTSGAAGWTRAHSNTWLRETIFIVATPDGDALDRTGLAAGDDGPGGFRGVRRRRGEELRTQLRLRVAGQRQRWLGRRRA